jgi:16S rRNA (guanine966-N2)-methyltransferase
VILLDPPYRQGWLERLEPKISRVLATGAKVYLEAEAPVEAFAGLACLKQGKAGQVHYRLFSHAAAAGESA